MKYNRYLIAGVILITLTLMILFSGMMSGHMADYANNGNGPNNIFDTGTVIIGMLIPIILAVAYIYFKPAKRD